MFFFFFNIICCITLKCIRKLSKKLREGKFIMWSATFGLYGSSAMRQQYHPITSGRAFSLITCYCSRGSSHLYLNSVYIREELHHHPCINFNQTNRKKKKKKESLSLFFFSDGLITFSQNQYGCAAPYTRGRELLNYSVVVVVGSDARYLFVFIIKENGN